MAPGNTVSLFVFQVDFFFFFIQELIPEASPLTRCFPGVREQDNPNSRFPAVHVSVRIGQLCVLEQGPV